MTEEERTRKRIRLWADEEIATGNLRAKAVGLLDAPLYRGELRRGDVPGLPDTSARSARAWWALVELPRKSSGVRSAQTATRPAPNVSVA